MKKNEFKKGKNMLMGEKSTLDHIMETNAITEPSTEETSVVDKTIDIYSSMTADEKISYDTDVEKEIEKINKMNFLEILNYQKKLQNERSQLTGTKNAMKTIHDQAIIMSNQMDSVEETFVANATYGEKIAYENILDDAEYKKSLEEFEKEYPIIISKYDKFEEAILRKLTEYEKIEKNTSFMTAQMLCSIDNRLMECEAKGITDQRYLKQFLITKEVFGNRFNLKFLYNKSLLTHTIDNIKKDYNKNNKKFIKKYFNDLSKFILPKQIEMIGSYIRIRFGMDADATHIFMSHLTKITINEQNSHLYNWTKVFFMNILDIMTKTMDSLECPDLIDKYLISVYPIYKLKSNKK